MDASTVETRSRKGELEWLDISDDELANFYAFLQFRYPGQDIVKLLDTYDKNRLNKMLNVSSQLQMSEEERNLKLRPKYDKIADEGFGLAQDFLLGKKSAVDQLVNKVH